MPSKYFHGCPRPWTTQKIKTQNFATQKFCNMKILDSFIVAGTVSAATAREKWWNQQITKRTGNTEGEGTYC